jgi:TetR/AcrR family transcriptional regulator, transcriptional repressor of bet genes
MPGRKASEENRREDILRAAYDVAAREGVEALTVRAVAARAGVSHGTVLFHFKRRSDLVVTLLDRVLDGTAVLRVPQGMERLTRPSDRMHALLRGEMDRLSEDPRRFRLFLEYWTLGVRSAPIRRKVSAALDRYRSAFRTVTEAMAEEEWEQPPTRGGTGPLAIPRATPEGLAAVAVSFVHGCALQAVIDPKGFDVQPHFDAAAHMLDRLVPEPAGPV